METGIERCTIRIYNITNRLSAFRPNGAPPDLAAPGRLTKTLCVMLRTCPECENHAIPVGTVFWSSKNLQCTNCGATYKLKSTMFSQIAYFITILVFGSPIILIVFGYWQAAISVIVIATIAFPFYEAKFGRLKPEGLRAKLRGLGVNIDPEKAASVRKDGT